MEYLNMPCSALKTRLSGISNYKNYFPDMYQVGRPLVLRGFGKCFLRVPQAVGLYCSYTAAPASKGNFQKIYYKTFGTSGRPTWYNNVYLSHSLSPSVLVFRVCEIETWCPVEQDQGRESNADDGLVYWYEICWAGRKSQVRQCWVFCSADS